MDECVSVIQAKNEEVCLLGNTEVLQRAERVGWCAGDWLLFPLVCKEYTGPQCWCCLAKQGVLKLYVQLLYTFFIEQNSKVL